MVSKAFGGETARRPHLAHDGKGGLPGEVGDLRSDVEVAFRKNEGRTAADEYPELEWVSGGAPAAAGGDATLRGQYLLQGQAFASLTLGASLDIIACVPGLAGNDYSVEVVDTGGGGLTIAMPASKLTIDLGGATPNEDTIATALNNAAAANYQTLRADSGGGAAFGTVTEANLTGGTGEGWSCVVAGVAAPIKHDTGAATSNANLSETSAIVTIPNLTAGGDPRAVGDPSAITVATDGVRTQTVAVVLA